MTESLDEKIRRVLAEDVALVPYDDRWPVAFRAERDHLLADLPAGIVRRIEHFGSTAVPGLAAKPIVDMLVEVADLADVRQRVAPLLEAQGYDYFWRPTAGEDTPPFYAWFIRRDRASGARTHHIHMVEASFREHWDRLLFRDYLRAQEMAAREYEKLKYDLAARFPRDRVAYTRGKSAFIENITAIARGGTTCRPAGAPKENDISGRP